MASRMMHLAVAETLLRSHPVPDPARFRLGVLLPDAYRAGYSKWITHWKTELPGGLVTYDLRGFRQRYCDRMTNSLYLGYYLHLWQDMLFRRLLYSCWGWTPSPENGARLHVAYRLLNEPLRIEYGLRPEDVSVPRDFAAEPLSALYPFDLPALLRGLEEDFAPYTAPPTGFFTLEQARRFVREAHALCLRELDALARGESIEREEGYSWPGGTAAIVHR